MVNYPLGDTLIRIKNAARAHRHEVVAENSKLIESVANVLKSEKYLAEVKVEDGKITMTLAYHKKEPLLIDLKLVSTPGLRVYMDMDDLKARKRRNASILILSTPKGIMSSAKAQNERAGGEVIAEIW